MKLRVKSEKAGGFLSRAKRFIKNHKPLVIIVGILVAAAIVTGAILLCLHFADKPEPSPVPLPSPSSSVVIPPIKDEENDFSPFTSAALKTAHEVNNDVVGWLSVPACEIDNPVFQSYDNDFYLRKNEAGEYDVWGCYFLDYINNQDGDRLYDRVSIIYGHSLGDYAESEKFSKLKRYKDAAFAAENPTVTFSLLYDELEFEIFAVSDIPISIDYIDPNPDDAKYRETLGYMLSHSYVDFGITPTTDDNILILSTCTSDDAVRFTVAARQK